MELYRRCAMYVGTLCGHATAEVTASDLVVAKVGKPTERFRPGNRGKRDSQVLAMRFLNRAHNGSDMYPLELEMMHQCKNIIGVDPRVYEVSLPELAKCRLLTDASTCSSSTPTHLSSPTL